MKWRRKRRVKFTKNEIGMAIVILANLDPDEWPDATSLLTKARSVVHEIGPDRFYIDACEIVA